MKFYKTILSILLTVVCSTIVFGQNIVAEQGQKKKIIPQFEFSQIDSIVDDAIDKINSIDSQSTVVASVTWSIGSYSFPTDKYSAHRNHFDIYVLNFTDNKCSIQKIDNFGYFKAVKINASNVKDFLSSHLKDMQFEQLNPKIDTIYNGDGSIRTSRTYTTHQLLENVKIVKGTNKLGYEYPADYSNNKYNLLTYRFKFLNLIDELRKRYNKKKHKRETVAYGLYNP